VNRIIRKSPATNNRCATVAYSGHEDAYRPPDEKESEHRVNSQQKLTRIAYNIRFAAFAESCSDASVLVTFLELFTNSTCASAEIDGEECASRATFRVFFEGQRFAEPPHIVCVCPDVISAHKGKKCCVDLFPKTKIQSCHLCFHHNERGVEFTRNINA
jgi:hypothetical protein